MCCFTTVILSSKVTFFGRRIVEMKCDNVKMFVVWLQDVKPSQGLTWVHVHQTWMDGSTSDDKNWFL